MRADRLKNLVLSFNLLAFVPLPKGLNLFADLLVDFRLDIVLALVQNCDIIGENRHLNLRSLSTVEGGSPPLDEEA